MTYSLIPRPLLVAQNATLARLVSPLTSNERIHARWVLACGSCALECCKAGRSQKPVFAIFERRLAGLVEVSYMD
jgi:hypothetical protein